ncbi:MAG: carbon storage regulator CsrA [Actinomycetaceae bacterium]|nr:carbon storage regulator CsrA [Actinomycetaceae bacterium]
MLVLSRRLGEKIVIGENIVITVVEVHRDSVRIGIDAPRSVPVNRAELLEAVSEENVASTTINDQDAAKALAALRGISAAKGKRGTGNIPRMPRLPKTPTQE